MGKVGLAIVTYTINYGTFLQAFATQNAINQLGFQTEIININSVIKDVSKQRKKYFAKQILNIPEVRSYFATIQSLIQKKINPGYKKYMQQRERCFHRFQNDFFSLGPICNSWSGLSEYCKKFSSVVVGSDQLWRPANIAGNFYTLNFVPNEVNKVAYATSFGLSSVRKNQEQAVVNFLKRINFLSSREESGVQIIKNLTGRSAKWVCDPTLLLPKEEWEKHLQPSALVKGDYILMYLLSSNKQHRVYVKQLAKQTNCKIVGVLHGAGYICGDEKYVDEVPTNIGPFEFLNLIKNAKFVCTDSFHGCVFSTIFERDFYAFKRFCDDNNMSTNSRVTGLLNKLGLTNRLVQNFNEFNLTPVNYENVKQEVRSFRAESLQYLNAALSAGKGVEK